MTEETNQPEPNEEEQVEPGDLFFEIVSLFFNQAAMALGAAPNPVTGGLFVSFEQAQLFITYLEALQVKTVGNLSEEEDKTLKKMIDELKMAFVHSIRDPRVREIAERCRAQAEAQSSEDSGRIVTPDGRPASTASDSPRIIIP